MANDPWARKLTVDTPADLYWPIVWSLQANPIFSMFTEKAIHGIATVVVEGLVERTTKEETNAN